MTIDEARQHLSAYLDGELDPVTRRGVEAALEAQPELRAELDGLRRTVRLVRLMPRTPAPAGFAGRVLAALEAPAAEAPVRSRWARHWRPALLAAAACLVLGLGVLIAYQARRPRTGAVAHKRHERLERAEESPAPATTRAPLHDERAAHDAGLKARRPGGDAGSPLDTAKGPGERPPDAGEFEEHDRRAKAANGFMAKDDKGKLAYGFEELPGGQREIMPAPDHAAPANGLAYAQKELMRSIEQPRPELARQLSELRDVDRPAPEPGARLTGAVGAPTPPHREPAARRVSAAEASGEAVAQTAAGRGGAPVHVARFVYDDLPECLAEVQAALRDANVSFAIQPVGSGWFKVEATMAQGEAAALLARLGQERLEITRAKPEAGRAPMVRQPVVPGAAVGGRAPVHLVLYFRSARGAAAEADAEPATQQPPEPSKR